MCPCSAVSSVTSEPMLGQTPTRGRPVRSTRFFVVNGSQMRSLNYHIKLRQVNSIKIFRLPSPRGPVSRGSNFTQANCSVCGMCIHTLASRTEVNCLSQKCDLCPGAVGKKLGKLNRIKRPLCPSCTPLRTARFHWVPPSANIGC